MWILRFLASRLYGLSITRVSSLEWWLDFKHQGVALGVVTFQVLVCCYAMAFDFPPNIVFSKIRLFSVKELLDNIIRESLSQFTDRSPSGHTKACHDAWGGYSVINVTIERSPYKP